MRVALYARYSTDGQNPRSTEDQLYDARRYAHDRGWTVVAAFKDEAQSGSGTRHREGYQRLMAAAKDKQFDCVLAEDLDRISRKIRDLANFYDIMSFIGIQVWTIADGPASNMHIGLKGTISAEFLKNVAQKTRRGQAAAIRSGRRAGGISYGYRRTATPGIHEIDEEEAEVVRRIFRMRLAGQSSRDIAGILNREKIPSPRGGEWSASTIHGCSRKVNGILRNPLYVGRLVWNRRSYLKNPEDESLVTRVNDAKDYVESEVPDLRIIEQELWDSVQQMIAPRRAKRTIIRTNGYLLSGLVRCGACGGSYASTGGSRYPRFGCSSFRERKTCTNNRIVSVGLLDNAVLSALQSELLDDDLIESAARELAKEFDRQQARNDKRRPKLVKRTKEIDLGRKSLLRLLEQGISAESVRDRLLELDREEAEVAMALRHLPALIEIPHADAVSEYKEFISKLELIGAPATRAAMRDVATKVRDLIDHIVVYPNEDPLGRDVELVGELATLFGQTHTSMDLLVAGAGFEPATFRL